MNSSEQKALIIGVGFQKTGTSTLREALKILGYRVKDTSRRALIPILKGKWNQIIKMLKNYDAVEDTPWYMIYKELDTLFPNSKFILTIRDEEKWYKSIKNHIGNLRSAHHEWIYGRGKGLPIDHKQNTLNVYNTHNNEVREYFKDRPDDLLVVDFTKGDGWDELCNFLNKDIPSTDFPHYNKTDWTSKKRKTNKLKFLRKQIKSRLKIRYIDLMDLW